MDKTQHGFLHGVRRGSATDGPSRWHEYHWAEAVPLMAFGATCLGLAGWLSVSNPHAVIGRYELWPYLVVVGLIAAVGGTASLFARWESEAEAEEGTADNTEDPDTVRISRSEWEALRAAYDPIPPRRAPAWSEGEPTVEPVATVPLGITPPTFDAPESTETETPSTDPAVTPPVERPPSPPAEVVTAPPAAPAVVPTAEGPEPEAAAPPPSPPAPSTGPVASALGAGAPPSNAVLQSFLSHLRPLVTQPTGTGAPEPAAPPAGRPPTEPDEPPATTTPTHAESMPAVPPTSDATVPSTSSDASGDADIQGEFDRLLEALASGGPARSVGELPQCVSCDRPVQLPYTSCQGCGNPLCADCLTKAQDEGHPRRCPTCALLQKFT